LAEKQTQKKGLGEIQARKTDYEQLQSYSTDILYILTALIIILMLVIILVSAITMAKAKITESQQAFKASSCALENQKIMRLYNETLSLRENLAYLQNCVSERELVINRLNQRLNLSEDIRASPVSR
jgi:hypothetical protein